MLANRRLEILMPEKKRVPTRSAGGAARAANLSAEERSAIAKKAARTRWGPEEPTHVGVLTIGEMEIPCAVLADGRRVLSQRGVGKALGRGFGGKDWRRQGETDAGKLPFFLTANTLKPFISNELMTLVTSPIEYRHGRLGGNAAHGIDATALPQICDVWLKARESGALNESQRAIAQRAELLMRGLAHVGIVALVDEATGYQEIRDKKALQAILEQFLTKELAAWAKRFPDEFYQQIFRLKNWEWRGMKVNRPQVVGAYTRDIVYARLAPGIVEELERRNPRNDKGQRPGKHHQWLTEDVGHPALAQHLHAVIGLMRASDTWMGFKSVLDRAFPKRGQTLELPLNQPS